VFLKEYKIHRGRLSKIATTDENYSNDSMEVKKGAIDVEGGKVSSPKAAMDGDESSSPKPAHCKGIAKRRSRKSLRLTSMNKGYQQLGYKKALMRENTEEQSANGLDRTATEPDEQVNVKEEEKELRNG